MIMLILKHTKKTNELFVYNFCRLYIKMTNNYYQKHKKVSKKKPLKDMKIFLKKKKIKGK